MAKPFLYVEPEDYFPDEILKEYELGEYNKDVEQEESEQEMTDEDTDEECAIIYDYA